MSTETIDNYAVMGNPIAHSKSPQIHQQFAELTAQKLSYNKIKVEPGEFKQAVADFIKHNGKGLNITVPLKEEAFALAHQLTDRAQRAGAVNTLILNNTDNIIGDNTDGVGLVNDLTKNYQQTLNNKSILILGAGGAVRGILEPFINQQPKRIVIANRTLKRAQLLAEAFSDIADIEVCEYQQLDGQLFDIVINGTSASLAGELPPLPDKLFNKEAVAYDMMYSKQPTTFMQWASSHNAKHVFDGLGMLVEQAAESFYCWRGIRPETLPVITLIRNKL